jgi:N-terminal domain of reverse transcriptase
MTAKPTVRTVSVAGAVSHDLLEWHAIDWRRVQQNVRRLQARIVKAVQEGRWGKGRALQHLLTHSFSAKALAVRRVTENQGKRIHHALDSTGMPPPVTRGFGKA